MEKPEQMGDFMNASPEEPCVASSILTLGKK
jgi:hypothetical protein